MSRTDFWESVIFSIHTTDTLKSLVEVTSELAFYSDVGMFDSQEDAVENALLHLDKAVYSDLPQKVLALERELVHQPLLRPENRDLGKALVILEQMKIILGLIHDKNTPSNRRLPGTNPI